MVPKSIKMTGDLHEISAAIGGLRSITEEHSRQTERIFVKLDELAGFLSPLPALIDRMNKIEPLVNSLEADRQRGKGILVGIALACGGAAATAFEAIKTFLIKVG